jgi:hypothetical protein
MVVFIAFHCFLKHFEMEMELLLSKLKSSYFAVECGRCHSIGLKYIYSCDNQFMHIY